MLHHEEPTSSAAQERVAADELARAIAAIEGRRQQQAERLKGTLSIGEAVRDLDLDATPDEVWAEVQAQRARRDSAQEAGPSSQASPSSSSQPSTTPPLPHALGAALRDAAAAAAPGLRQAAQAAAPSLKQGIDAVSRSLAAQNAVKPAPSRRENAKQGLTVFAIVCAMLGTMAGTGVLGHLHTPHSAPLRALSTIPDNHPVSADTATVQRLQAGTLPSAVQVQDGEVGDTWTLIKHNGVVYVRGYTLPLSDKALSAGDVKVYNDDNAGVLHGVEDAEVTLRLDSLKIDDTDSGQGWHEIDVSGIHPDSYIRENW